MSREELTARSKPSVRELEATAHDLRAKLLHLSHSYSGPIHIGGDFSAADVLTALFHYGLEIDPTDIANPARDRFVLSKGHAAVCMYITMAQRGFFPFEDIVETYGALDSAYGMHPCKVQLPGVECSTGSLGHGLPIATGMAMAARQANADHRVFTLLGDGETGEGSIWEAALAARSAHLGNLVAVVDRNRQLMTSFDGDLVSLEPYADKWRAFGWNVVPVDGHDMAALVDMIDALPDPASDTPTVIVAETVKGKGVAFMESNLGWHAGSLGDADFEAALAALQSAFTQGATS